MDQECIQTFQMRRCELESEELYSTICDKLGEVHEEGIASYGSDNDMRTFQYFVFHEDR